MWDAIPHSVTQNLTSFIILAIIATFHSHKELRNNANRIISRSLLFEGPFQKILYPYYTPYYYTTYIHIYIFTNSINYALGCTSLAYIVTRNGHDCGFHFGNIMDMIMVFRYLYTVAKSIRIPEPNAGLHTISTNIISIVLIYCLVSDMAKGKCRTEKI